MQYWLGDSETNVQVKWYRSRDEQIAGRIEGENIKHTDISGQTTVKTNSVTTMQYGLQIKNFSNNDIGYYWCQMVVNNTTLPPSPYGYIHSPQCSLTEMTCNIRNQPLCAQNLTLRHMAVSEQNGMNCTIEAMTFSTITTAKSTIIKPNDSSARCDFSKDGYPCAAGVIAAAVVTTGILLLVFFCLLMFIIKSRKKQLGKLIMH